MLNIYQIGRFIAESGDGINEFLYQYGNLLKKVINVKYISFDIIDGNGYEEIKEDIGIYHFKKPKLKGLIIDYGFYKWLKTINNSQVIFHLHGTFNPTNYIIAKILVHYKFKYIFTPHDSYSKNSLRKNKIQKKIYISICEKFILNNATYIHALTLQGKLDIEKVMKRIVSKIIVVPNFIKKQNNQIQYKMDYQLCFIGRFDIYQKGLDEMLKSICLLKKKHNIIPKAVFIGTYDEKSIRIIKEDCSHLNLKYGEEIIVTGKISTSDKISYLKKSKIYFQLSRFEGFGISIIEALSQGKPVVISNNIPIGNIIEKYAAGYISKDYIEAAEKIKYLLTLTNQEFQKISQNAINCFESEFSENIVKAKVLQMYQKININ